MKKITLQGIQFQIGDMLDCFTNNGKSEYIGQVVKIDSSGVYIRNERYYKNDLLLSHELLNAPSTDVDNIT